MSTVAAQRRLLESLADLERITPGGIAGVRLGMEIASVMAESEGVPQVVAVYRAIDDVAAAVQRDVNGVVL